MLVFSLKEEAERQERYLEAEIDTLGLVDGDVKGIIKWLAGVQQKYSEPLIFTMEGSEIDGQLIDNEVLI